MDINHPDEEKYFREGIRLARLLEKEAEEENLPHGIPPALVIGVDVSTESEKLKEKIAAAKKDVKKKGPTTEKELGWDLVNHWRTKKPWKGSFGTVGIFKHRETGRIKKKFIPSSHEQLRLEILKDTIWNLRLYVPASAERKAQKELLKLLSFMQKQQYIVSDTFFERGKSGILYLFRKNRPIIVLKTEKDDEGIAFQTMGALCMHSLGYYTNSWAGVLAPSDDLITQLLTLRADELRLWRKSEWHSAEDFMAGIG